MYFGHSDDQPQLNDAEILKQIGFEDLIMLGMC